MNKGIGNCLIIASEETKTTDASVKTEEIKAQIIRPEARKGRNSLGGYLNMFPKIIPIVPIITPVEMVIQKGPIVDLRYRCLMSEYER